MDGNEKKVFFNVITELCINTWSSDESSTSGSDLDDLYIKDQEPRRKRQKIENFVEVTVKGYTKEEFKSHFRMEQQTVYKLIDNLEQSNFLPKHTFGREKITPEKAFLLTLWYVANTESFRQIKDRFNVSKSSAHKCLKKVLNFIVSLKSEVIKFPSTLNEKETIARGFQKIKGIPNVLGAIDGTHIEINRPLENEDCYVNRKGYHSLLMQGIVDSNRRFIDIYCGEAGSMHDARLLRKSPIYKKLTESPNFLENYFFIGDSAYPNLDWIVGPFSDNGFLNENQKTFNYRLSATRMKIEHAFGLLKGRFRRLKKLENFDLKLCSDIILSCCILHNICLNENDILEVDEHDFNQPQALPYTGNSIHNRRQEIFNQMFN